MARVNRRGLRWRRGRPSSLLVRSPHRAPSRDRRARRTPLRALRGPPAPRSRAQMVLVVIALVLLGSPRVHRVTAQTNDEPAPFDDGAPSPALPLGGVSRATRCQENRLRSVALGRQRDQRREVPRDGELEQRWVAGRKPRKGRSGRDRRRARSLRRTEGRRQRCLSQSVTVRRTRERKRERDHRTPPPTHPRRWHSFVLRIAEPWRNRPSRRSPQADGGSAAKCAPSRGRGPKHRAGYAARAKPILSAWPIA